MATIKHVSRRSLLTASAATLAGTAVAATPALVSAAVAAPGLSPRLVELKKVFDETAADEVAVRRDPRVPGGGDDWVAAWEALTDIAYEVMREPVASSADFAFKLAVWDLTIRDTEPTEFSDDLSEVWGWMDRAPYRLIEDARQLLIGAGAA